MDELNKHNLKLYPISVHHCHYSMGLLIKTPTQKILFSSDRDGSLNPRQNEEFLKAAKNCDILIHESTFCDQDVDKAKASMHSTFG